VEHFDEHAQMRADNAAEDMAEGYHEDAIAVSQKSRVETIRCEAFDYEELRGKARRWIETEMVISGRRLWRWTAEYLGENNYELTFKTLAQ
jgi:hypothetical protein